MKNIIKVIAIFVFIAIVTIEAKSFQQSMQSEIESIGHHVAEFKQFQIGDKIAPLLFRERRSPQVPQPPIPSPEDAPAPPAGIPGVPI